MMWRRAIIAAGVCLPTGAALNVLLAWALAAWGSGGVVAGNFVGTTVMMVPAGGPPGVQYTRGSVEASGVGWSSVATDSQSNPPSGPYTLDIRWRAGWPLHSLGAHHRATSAQPALGPVALPQVPAGMAAGLPIGARAERRLPLTPLWPGFAANSAVFAVLPLGILGWATWRRLRRERRQGCCAACGYPIGVSPVCTECGAAVTPSGAAAP